MLNTIRGENPISRGLWIHRLSLLQRDSTQSNLVKLLEELNLRQYVKIASFDSDRVFSVYAELKPEYVAEWIPGGDTAGISSKLNLDTVRNPKDLEREILLAMLACPIVFEFPSYEEFISSVRIRQKIVEAARKTSLSFATNEAERPADYWNYDEDQGFIVRPEKSLIDALRYATQPELSGQRYTFSCRRAGEYIVLLAVAREAAEFHEELFYDLQKQAETRALKGREFEAIFHRQLGSWDNPLPVKFFIPGDRTWFRNPDDISGEITGYEGSWTFYLGNGVFADFWRPNQFYSLTTKCLSIYHWRNSTFRDANGELQIDESRVEAQVEKSLKDPLEMTQILTEMLRLQVPSGGHGGGCVEPHREYVRQVCRGTSDLKLPDIARPAHLKT